MGLFTRRRPARPAATWQPAGSEVAAVPAYLMDDPHRTGSWAYQVQFIRPDAPGAVITAWLYTVADPMEGVYRVSARYEYRIGEAHVAGGYTDGRDIGYLDPQVAAEGAKAVAELLLLDVWLTKAAWSFLNWDGQPC